jgi:hypothetical protein
MARLHIMLPSLLPARFLCRCQLHDLGHFWPKIRSGAFVLLDASAWYGYEEQMATMDDLVKYFDTKILALPTGQGLIIKR